MSAYVWTERNVEYRCYQRVTDEDFDALMDAFIEHYWEGLRHRLLGTLSIAPHGHTITVGLWPRWVPAWVARRSVANIAAAHGIGGGATFVVGRAVLGKSARAIPEGDA